MSEQLQVQVVQPGEAGRQAKNGDSLVMHYEGTLVNGAEFDSSYKRGDPFRFTLGQGMVIPGWDQGIVGMCRGEVRHLTIPSHLAYGDDGYPPVIPPKATLKFKIELLEFQ